MQPLDERGQQWFLTQRATVVGGLVTNACNTPTDACGQERFSGGYSRRCECGTRLALSTNDPVHQRTGSSSRRSAMKPYLLVLPVILATTAVTADPLPVLADAQLQAAALLSATHTSASFGTNKQRPSQSPASPARDAQGSAAALLSSPRRSATDRRHVHVASAARVSADAQKQASALLSSS
jgi:hypothetical protein